VHDPSPFCFLGENDLAGEIYAFREKAFAGGYMPGAIPTTLGIIDETLRACGTKWIAGLTVREQFQAYQHAETRRANTVATAVAVCLLLATVLTTFKGAEIQARATLQAAQDQIHAQETLQPLYAVGDRDPSHHHDSVGNRYDGGYK